jgi:hypothetical protein
MAQTLFDIAQSRPYLPLSHVVPPAACILFAVACLRPSAITALTAAYWRLAGPLLQKAANNPIAVLVFSLIPAILGLLSVARRMLIPGILVFGAWTAQEIYTYQSDWQKIHEMRSAAIDATLEGKVTRLERYPEQSMFMRGIRWHELLFINGKSFDYTEDEAGSPYPLTAFWPTLKTGSEIRLSTSQGKIVRIELLSSA